MNETEPTGFNYYALYGAVIILAVIGAATLGMWHGAITGGAFDTILTSVVVLGGGILGVHVGATGTAKATARALRAQAISSTRLPAVTLETAAGGIVNRGGKST